MSSKDRIISFSPRLWISALLESSTNNSMIWFSCSQPRPDEKSQSQSQPERSHWWSCCRSPPSESNKTREKWGEVSAVLLKTGSSQTPNEVTGPSKRGWNCEASQRHRMRYRQERFGWPRHYLRGIHLRRPCQRRSLEAEHYGTTMPMK